MKYYSIILISLRGLSQTINAFIKFSGRKMTENFNRNWGLSATEIIDHIFRGNKELKTVVNSFLDGNSRSL